jgi:hypothetical protein
MDAELDALRTDRVPLRLIMDPDACRTGFRLWKELLLRAADEEEDCYRIGRVGLRDISFDDGGLRTELWVDDSAGAAVQINEPTDPTKENGLSAVAQDADGRRFLLRQGWLRASRGFPEVREAAFAHLTQLPIADVQLGRTQAKRQWHVVTPLDKVSADLAARATADFAERCWQARLAMAEDSITVEDWVSGLGDTDQAGVARLLERITQPRVAVALRYVMETAATSGLSFVFRKSGDVAAVDFQDGTRRNLYSVTANSEHLLFYLRAPAQQRAPHLLAAAVARYGEQELNSLGEYRIPITTMSEAQALLAWLRDTDAWDRIISRVGARTREPAATFETVTAEHILAAARRLADGFTDHAFGPSTDYDLLFEGQRLPPKAVFGLAATTALGRPIGPGDFSGGLGTTCFRALANAGYVILPRDESGTAEPDLSADDRLWAEGDPKLVTHLRRERGSGLSTAKRAQFIASHGKLFCERCEMDPVAHFGAPHGEACIEVHHNKVAVTDMTPGHRTELKDLQCLCANCHRVVHRELKLGIARPDQGGIEEQTT